MINRLKTAVLWLLGVCLLVLASYLMRRFLGEQSAGILIGSGAAFIGFLVVFLLQIGFVGSRKLLFLFSISEMLIPAAVFYDYLIGDFSPWFAGGIGACALLCAFGALHGRSYIDGSVKVRFCNMARQVLPKAALGIIVLAVAVFYGYFVAAGNFTEETGSRVFGWALERAEPIVQIWFRDLRFDMTMDEAIENMSEAQMRRIRSGQIIEGIPVAQLSPEAKRYLLSDIEQEVRSAVSRLGGSFGSDEKFGDYLYGIVNEKFTALPELAQSFLAAGIFVLMLLTLRFTVPILYPAIGLAGFLIFRLAVAAGFADIAYKDVKQEVVVM